jgi:FAD/FMN-containing dehydrogenase
MPFTLDRRDFLKCGSGAVLGLAVPSPAFAVEEVGEASPSDWADLARSLNGRLLQPGVPNFAALAAPWNLRFAATLPQAIARCASVRDVRTCLAFASATKVPFVIRSGGHSYAGFSTSTGLLLDVSAMNEVRYDVQSGRARLGGGARNANVYAGLAPLNRAITHGRCRGVGVAGLVLGGGIGFSQRRRGLTCDQLVEMELLSAGGEQLRCSENENADLFWACRGGGGGNFGVTIGMTFQTYPVDVVTAFRIVWDTRIAALLPAALDLLPSMPDRLGCKLSVDAGKETKLHLLGQIVGTKEELAGLLAPLYRIAAPSHEATSTLPYWESQAFLSEEGEPEYTHERSRYVYKPMPPEASSTILDHLRRWPGTSEDADWKMFLAGGAVARVKPEATAFVHRKALMLTSIDLEWGEADSLETIAANQAWVDAFHAAMRPFASDESYQNFSDEAETGFIRAYYGTNLERLVEIKRKYDPANLFRFAQSIPLAI